MIFWIEKDSVQTETESLKRTNRPKSLSPLHPLRGAKIAARERAIEVDPVAEARVEKGIGYVTNSGMVSVKRVKTVPTSMSKIPQDLAPPKRRVRAKAVAEVVPLTESQGKRWPRSHALTSNRANVVVVTNVSTNMKLQLHPQRIQKRTNSPAPKKKASAKAAPCITQRYACIAKGKGLPKATKAMKEQCHRAVVFSSKVEYIKVPATGEQRKVVHRPRIYEKTFPDSESVPKPEKLTAHRAQVSARQLQELVKLFGNDVQPKCRFRCNDPEGGVSCNHCRALIGPKNKLSNTHLPTVATPASKDGCVWLVDTGSEQDLISEGMLKTAKATNSPCQ